MRDQGLALRSRRPQLRILDRAPTWRNRTASWRSDSGFPLRDAYAGRVSASEGLVPAARCGLLWLGHQVPHVITHGCAVGGGEPKASDSLNSPQVNYGAQTTEPRDEVGVCLVAAPRACQGGVPGACWVQLAGASQPSARASVLLGGPLKPQRSAVALIPNSSHSWSTFCEME